MNDEIFLPVVGYEGLYKVSNFGNVISEKSGKKRSLQLAYGLRNKYYGVMLSNNKTKRNQLVHRMVAMAFIPNPENKPQVNHIDGVTTNNHVENLEWVSHQENVDHAVKMGIAPWNKGKRIDKSRICVGCAKEFQYKEKDQQFCSNSCARVYQHKVGRCSCHSQLKTFGGK